MKFGAPIWPFQWDPPYEDGISRIASLGFEAVELIGWNRKLLQEYYTPKKVKELRAFVEDSGLEISEFVSTPEGMASSDEKRRDQAVEHFKHAVEVAVGLGTGLVNTVSAYPFDLKFPRITDRPHLQQWTVDIPSGLDTASMFRLIEHVGSDALGMNFDPSHLFPVGETPHVVIYQLAERIFHCHFSDNDGTTNVHWRPGQGKIDWEAVLVALRDTGYDGVISIELEDVPGVSRGSVPAPGVIKERRLATEEFDRENVLAMEYLKDICAQQNIPVG
jgi:sugar phosphate isomerase/epimerase